MGIWKELIRIGSASNSDDNTWRVRGVHGGEISLWEGVRLLLPLIKRAQVCQRLPKFSETFLHLLRTATCNCCVTAVNWTLILISLLAVNCGCLRWILSSRSIFSIICAYRGEKSGGIE